MKTFTKILLSASILSAMLKLGGNVNPILTFIVCIAFFAAFIIVISLIDALKVKDADDIVAQAYCRKIEQFRLSK